MSTYKRSTKQEEEQQFRYPAYEKSDALRQAEAQLQQHTASQPSAYQSQYKDQMSSLLTELDNRPEFRYDADGDALYRQYKDAYIRNGRRAMEDTMGQAAAQMPQDMHLISSVRGFALRNTAGLISSLKGR